jgi:hypothetical protein
MGHAKLYQGEFEKTDWEGSKPEISAASHKFWANPAVCAYAYVNGN